MHSSASHWQRQIILYVFKWTDPVGGNRGQKAWIRWRRVKDTKCRVLAFPSEFFLGGGTDKGATEGRLQVTTLGYTMLVKKAKKPNFVEIYLSWLPAEGRQKETVSESDCCRPSDMNFKNYEKQSRVPRFSWTLEFLKMPRLQYTSTKGTEPLM